VCEEKRRDGKILYLMLCNGKWLKVYHIVLFYLEDVRQWGKEYTLRLHNVLLRFM
jgi:hypothetical protein